MSRTCPVPLGRRSTGQVVVRGRGVPLLSVVSAEERWPGDFGGTFLAWELDFFQTSGAPGPGDPEQDLLAISHLG